MNSWIISLLTELFIITFFVFYYADNDYIASAYFIWVYTTIFPITIHYRAKFQCEEKDSTAYYLTSFRKLINGQKDELNKNQLYALYVALGLIIISSVWVIIVSLFFI